MSDEMQLPYNVPELVRKATAAIVAQKAKLAGSKKDAQDTLRDAKLKQVQAEQRIREIEEAEKNARLEAAELERQRLAEAAEERAKVEKLRLQDEHERQNRANIDAADAREEKARQRNKAPSVPVLAACGIGNPKALEDDFRRFEPSRRSKRAVDASHISPRSAKQLQAEQMQAIQEVAKARGETVKFSSEMDEDNDEENMDVISPFSLMALSPQGACEMYQKVRLNTIKKMMTGINRLIAKSVATSETVTIKEKRVRPDDTVDTLCTFTDEMREDMMALYRQKGWEVILEGNSKKRRYVFKPQPKEG